MIKIQQEVYIDIIKKLDIAPDRVSIFYISNNVYTIQYKSAKIIEEKFSCTPQALRNELISILRKLKVVDGFIDYDFYQKELDRLEKAFNEYHQRTIQREQDLLETQVLIHQNYERELKKLHKDISNDTE